MAWLLLYAASVLEIVWAVALKHSHGLTRLWPSLLSVTSAAASFYLLSLAVRTLPVGTAYAVWVGAGVVGVVSAGIVVHSESLTPLRLLFLGLIVSGVVGLKFVDH